MKSLHVKMLMGHDVGLAESYYKPTEEELLQEYLKATEDLTIEKPMKITEQTQESATQMESKDKQIQTLNEGLSEMKVQMERMREGMLHTIGLQVKKALEEQARKAGKNVIVEMSRTSFPDDMRSRERGLLL